MRKAIIAAFGLVLASCGARGSDTGGLTRLAAAPAEDKAGTYVIDGDTLVLSGEHIRIENIDAPELPAHAKCEAEAALALRAKARLEDALAFAGRPDPTTGIAPGLRIERDKARPKDVYGRTLALVYVGGEEIGSTLVREGYAAPWLGHHWPWCQTLALKAAP